MISAPKITSLLLAVALLAIPAVAQDPEPTEPPEQGPTAGTAASAPEGAETPAGNAAPVPTQSQVIPSGGRFTRLEAERIRGQPDQDLLLEGKVTIGWGEVLLQADRIEVKEGRFLDAEGHILMVWQENRISGSRVTYDLDADFGLIENAIGQVSLARGSVGADLNRLSSMGRSLEVARESVESAKSRILDADIAAEGAALARHQIVQQAAASVLAQANVQPQLALQLLGG